MALQHLYGIATGVSALHLPEVSKLVAAASGRPVALTKPIVGEAVFTDESGIHVSDLPLTQPIIRVSIQGNRSSHRLVLGKHSGTASISLGLPAAGYSHQ